MKKVSTKEVVLLCLPAMLLLGVGLALRGKPDLTVRSVQIKPAVDGEFRAAQKGSIEIELLMEYQEPWFTKFRRGCSQWTRRPELNLNAAYGRYVEDENGILYGKRCNPSQEEHSHLPPVRDLGIRIFYVKESLACRLYVPLAQIPKSAGRLTFKTLVEVGVDAQASARLPVAAVVREG